MAVPNPSIVLKEIAAFNVPPVTNKSLTVLCRLIDDMYPAVFRPISVLKRVAGRILLCRLVIVL